jgi:centrin-1
MSQTVVRLTDDQKQEIRDAFEQFDRDGSRSLDAKSFRLAMRGLGFDMPRSEVREFMSHARTDQCGALGFDAFFDYAAQKIAGRDPLHEMKKAFETFDKDHDGRISLNDLKTTMLELGENMTDEELREMIKQADRDLDGEVSEHDFIEIMKASGLFRTHDPPHTTTE